MLHTANETAKKKNEIYVQSDLIFDKVKREGANRTRGPMRGTSHGTNNN